MEKQKEQDRINLEGYTPKKMAGLSPGKSNTNTNTNTNYRPNPNYLISGTPQPSIALMKQNNLSSPLKKAESEKSLPISKAEMQEKKYRVQEEPANIRKYQEDNKDRVSNAKVRDTLDDSVNVKNFDSMEINRVTNIDYEKQLKLNRFSKSYKVERHQIEKKTKTASRDVSPRGSGIKNMPNNKRTPLHRKKNSELMKEDKVKKLSKIKKKSTMEDYTIDEIELRGMETNELLKYYDKQYQVSANDATNDQIEENTETHNQTMNTNDMLKSGQNQESFSKDQTLPSDIPKVTKKDDENDSLSHIDTTKVIRREIHDPNMKKGLKKRSSEQIDIPELIEESLGKDLLTKTQTQINKDLNSEKEIPKKTNLMRNNSKPIPRSPKTTLNKIPATRKVTPNSGQHIQIDEEKPQNIPKAVGMIPSKAQIESEHSQKHEKIYHIPTPSLQSTISKSNAQGSLSDIQVDESEPPEIDYSGSPDIPMTSKVEDEKNPTESSPEAEVRDYNILKYPEGSNLHTDSDLPENENVFDTHKDPFQKTLDLDTKQKIEHGGFADDTPQKEESGVGQIQTKTISDFDNRISENKNRILLSDMADVSRGERKSEPSIANELNGFENEFSDSSDKPVETQIPQEPFDAANESILPNPTKTPNMKKMTKLRGKKKPRKPKKDLKKNPFHNSDDEEQPFAKTENAFESRVDMNRKPSPQIDVSTDFLMTAMTTPNIKKKKKKSRKKRSKKNPEPSGQKKSYNLIGNNVVPQFNSSRDQNSNIKLPVQGTNHKSKKAKNPTRTNKYSRPKGNDFERPNPRSSSNRREKPSPRSKSGSKNKNPDHFDTEKNRQNNYPRKRSRSNQPHYENNFDMPKNDYTKPKVNKRFDDGPQEQVPDTFGIDNRFTLGRQAQRMTRKNHDNQKIDQTNYNNSIKEKYDKNTHTHHTTKNYSYKQSKQTNYSKHVQHTTTRSIRNKSNEKSVSNERFSHQKNQKNQTASEKRVLVKKLLRNSRRRLQQEVEETQIRRSNRFKSKEKSNTYEINDSINHEHKMKKYAIKGINRDKIRKEVLLKNSILQEDVPEIDSRLQKDLDNYEFSNVKRTLQKKKSRERSKKSTRRNKKDRLKKLEREIAQMTQKVERQVEDNEVFKTKVKRKYEDD